MGPGRTPPSTSPRRWKTGEQHGFARLVGVELNLGQGAMRKAGRSKPDTVLCSSRRLGTILDMLGEMKKATQPGEGWQKGFNDSVDELCAEEQDQFPEVVLPSALVESKNQFWSYRLSPDPSSSHEHLLETLSRVLERKVLFLSLVMDSNDNGGCSGGQAGGVFL